MLRIKYIDLQIKGWDEYLRRQASESTHPLLQFPKTKISKTRRKWNLFKYKISRITGLRIVHKDRIDNED